MSEERKGYKNHSVIVENRHDLILTGIIDVISFDEETIISDTEMGILIIRGNNLHVSKMDLEKGDMAIDGDIISLTYEDESNSAKLKGKSIFSNIFK